MGPFFNESEIEAVESALERVYDRFQILGKI